MHESALIVDTEAPPAESERRVVYAVYRRNEPHHRPVAEFADPRDAIAYAKEHDAGGVLDVLERIDDPARPNSLLWLVVYAPPHLQ